MEDILRIPEDDVQNALSTMPTIKNPYSSSIWSDGIHQFIANKVYSRRNAPKIEIISEHPEVIKLKDALQNRQLEAAKNKQKVVGLRLLYGSKAGGVMSPEFDLEECVAIYDSEPFVSSAIRRQLNIWFKQPFTFVSPERKLADYLNQRFMDMAFVTGIPTLQLFKMIIRDLLRFSNAFLIKYRDKDLSGIAKFKPGRPAPVAGYFPVSALNMYPRFNNGKLVSWIRYLDDGTMAAELNPKDVIHFTFEREPDFMFGKPRTLGAVEDIAALRRIEENVEVLLQKYLFPLFQLTIGTPEAPAQYLADGVSELEIGRDMLEAMQQEGMLVGTERHKLEMVGAKSGAMDARHYLSHFKSRVFTALGISPLDMGEGDCYDEATQTLTENGWKYHYEIDHIKEKIATYNPKTHQIEFEYATYKYEGFYQGDMIRFSGKHLDMLVTPKHDMWIKERHAGSQFNKDYKAMNLFARSQNSEWHFMDAAPITNITKTFGAYQKDGLPELVGYYASEGCLDAYNENLNKYRINLSQQPGIVLDAMKDAVKRLGFKYNICQGHNAMSMTFSNKKMFYWLKENVGQGSYNKHLPKDILAWNFIDKKKLLDALIDGDGSRDKRPGRTNFVYYTVSDQLADDVQILAMSLGYSAKVVKTKQSAKSYGTWINRVLISDKSIRSINRAKHMNSEYYEGVIYCYNVPNHLFVTRRNGKVAIQGNTANRSTADNISQNLKERVLDDQGEFASQVIQFMVSELLMEHPEDISVPRNLQKIRLHFPEVDLDNKIKKENHAINLWNNGGLTEDEFRAELGKMPIITNEERSKTKHALIDIPLALISAVDEPFSSEAKAAVKARTTADKAAVGSAPKTKTNQAPKSKPGTGASSSGRPKGSKKSGTPASRAAQAATTPTNQHGTNPGPTKAKSSLEKDLVGIRLSNFISIATITNTVEELENTIDDRFADPNLNEILKNTISKVEWNTIDMDERRSVLVAELIMHADLFKEGEEPND